eukprot:scaffold21913_cov64-Isochrysis_galbana.AAC.1
MYRLKPSRKEESARACPPRAFCPCAIGSPIHSRALSPRESRFRPDVPTTSSFFTPRTSATVNPDSGRTCLRHLPSSHRAPPPP